MTLTLLVRWWRELAIGVLALALMASCVARDHRIASTAVAQEHSRQADSVLRVVTPRLVITDTLVVHDTVEVRVAVNKVLRLRDTLLLHLTDTMRVKEYITQTDSALAACTELSNDCAQFRTWAHQTIDALTAKAAAAPQIVVKSCTESDVVWGGIGAAAGFLAGRHR